MRKSGQCTLPAWRLCQGHPLSSGQCSQIIHSPQVNASNGSFTIFRLPLYFQKSFTIIRLVLSRLVLFVVYTPITRLMLFVDYRSSTFISLVFFHSIDCSLSLDLFSKGHPLSSGYWFSQVVLYHQVNDSIDHPLSSGNCFSQGIHNHYDSGFYGSSTAISSVLSRGRTLSSG